MEIAPTLTTIATELVRRYILRAIDEEALRMGDEESPQVTLLRDFSADVKQSDRFVLFGSLREVHETYLSVASNDFMRDFLHQGATYVIMSMGEENYIAMVKDLSNAIVRGYWTSEHTSKVPEKLLEVLLENPWLVLCILARHAWFAEKKEEK